MINIAKLYFKYSTMGGGKTLDLLRTAYNYEECGKFPLLLTSAIDDRYEVGKITTRVGLQRDAIAINKDTIILGLFLQELLKRDRIDVILVDEAMFLTSQQVWQLAEIVDKFNTPVVCYGLKVDYRGKPFDGSNTLMTIADKIEEIKAICHCGRKANMNARIINNKIAYDGDQIQIGGNESYIALCRRCWKEGKIKGD